MNWDEAKLEDSFPRSSVGMRSSTLRVVLGPRRGRAAEDAERPGRHSHAERGNEWKAVPPASVHQLERREDVFENPE